MSPVSETTVVMARNWSSLLVMDEPPSATSLYPNEYPVPVIVAPRRVISKREAWGPAAALRPLLCDPTTSPVLEAQSPPLYNRRFSRFRRNDAGDQRHQRPRHAAMRDDEGVSGQRIQPRTHARGQHRVALAAQRREIPPVPLTRLKVPHVSPLDFPPGHALPNSEAEFLQAWVEPVATRRQSHRISRGLGLIKPVDLPPDTAP